jgi:hypothetical protein
VARLFARGRNRTGRLAACAVRSLALSLGVTAAAAAFAPDATAYEVKKTSQGQLVHWEEPDVDFSLDPSLGRNVDGAPEAAALAMDGWSGSVGAPDMHAHPAVAGVSPDKPGYDGKNGVFFMRGGYEPAGRALAITVLTYDNASGRILDADVIVNGAYSFAVLDAHAGEAARSTSSTHPSSTDGISHDEEPAADASTIYDLYHVVAHEFGHSLGMNDELERTDALMYRYSAPNDATLRQPAADDITGLAELYSTKLEGRGNGCGGATVSPKKPSLAAEHAALFGALGLLLFLLLRARSDRRARLGFVLAAVASGVVLMPDLTKDAPNAGVARASEAAPGQARARVFASSATMQDGLVRTTFEVATTVCRAAGCPKLAKGVVWGGTIGGVRQDVGGQLAPQLGDEVDVSFGEQAAPLAPLAHPLGQRGAPSEATVTVVTAAD